MSNIDKRHLELRQNIINTAYETVKARSFQQLTIRNIAKEVGCAIGMPYKLFKNMDEIIIEVNSITLQDIYDCIEGSYNNENDPIKNIYNIANSYINYTKENYNLWSMLFEYKINDKTQLSDLYKSKVANNFSLLEKTIKKIENTNYNKINSTPKIASRVLWAGIHGICILGNSGKLEITNSEDTETLVNSLIDNYISGLRCVSKL